MLKKTKNIRNKNITMIKNALNKNFDNTLRLIYRNRKNWISIKNKFDAVLKAKTKNFRKKYATENETIYNLRKKRFNKKTKRQLIIKLKTNFAKLRLAFKASMKAARPKRLRYFTIKYKFPVPIEIAAKPMKPFRKYRLKKYGELHKFYIKSINRWTKVPQARAKIFFSKLVSDKSSTNLENRVQILENYLSPELNDKLDVSNKLRLNLKNKTKYRKLKILRTRLLSKMPSIAFKPPGKYTKPYNKLNAKQAWVANKLAWLRMKKNNPKTKDFGIDFLKTMLGQQFLWAHKTTTYNFLRSNRKKSARLTRIWHGFRESQRIYARSYQAAQKRAWIYTNHVSPKKLPYYFQKNTVSKVYPFNKFKPHFKVARNTPWLSSLTSKRNLYSGFLTSERREFKWSQKFSWIPMLRNKFDVKQKKNKLYFLRNRLLYSREHRQVIRTDKKARIKQLLAKSTLPFYGHLRLKQFARLKLKAQIKKSLSLSREDIHLGYVERRLDVIVYRLNLAPTILWARKLIQDGSIFVSPSGANKSKAFEKMYAGYKQNSYPLKLRDPQNLYKKTLWQIYSTKKNSTKHVKLKFLLEPLRNINYLTQPGDVILCAPGALNNQYKSNKILWQKPIPTHLLSYSNMTETKNRFKSRSNAFQPFSRKEQTSTNVGIVMHNPTFNDLHSRDRIQKSFMRWMAL